MIADADCRNSLDTLPPWRILLTRGTGFIGARIAHAYLHAAHQVVHDFSRGKRQSIPSGVRA